MNDKFDLKKYPISGMPQVAFEHKQLTSRRGNASPLNKNEHLQMQEKKESMHLIAKQNILNAVTKVEMR